MKPFKKTTVAISVIAAVTGCASTEVTTKIDKDYSAAAAKVSTTKAALVNRPIILAELPYPYFGKKSALSSDSTEELPHIFRSKENVHFKQKAVTAEEFARLITEETGVPVKVLVDSKNNQSITTSGTPVFRKVEISTLPPMSMKQLVNTVAPMLGLDWDYYDGALHLESTFRKTYQISFSSSTGKANYKLGKTSSSQTGSSGGNTGLSGNFTSQMDSESSGEVNVAADLADTLAALAGGKENVVMNKSVGIATINCSKDCHNQVKKFVEESNHVLTQQVILRVNEITVSSTRNGQSGIDWNLVYQQTMASGKGYSFMFGAPAGVVSSAAGSFATNIVQPTGQLPDHFDGSKLLLKAISQASNVVENKPFDLFVQNNKTVTLSNMDQQAFTASTTVVPTGVGGTPVYSQNLGYANYGQLIQATPTIQPGGKINVRFGLDDTKVKQFVKAINQGDTDKLTLGGPKFATEVTLKVGATLILSGFKITQSTKNDSGLFSGQRVGSSSGNEETTETIILITPYLSGV